MVVRRVVLTGGHAGTAYEPRFAQESHRAVEQGPAGPVICLVRHEIPVPLELKPLLRFGLSRTCYPAVPTFEELN